MKKWAVVLAAVCVLFLFRGCACPGQSDHVKENFSDSAKFTKEELSAAGESVKRKFRDFHDCELTDIWYDAGRDGYKATDVENSSSGFIPKGTKGKDVMLLYSNFRTGANPDDGLEPNTTMQEWEWWLVRDGSGKWNVVSWGYG